MADVDLDQLLRCSPWLWRGRDDACPEVFSTGHEAMDSALPNGGWPSGCVVEMVVPRWGVGELQLWMPLVARLTQAGRYVVWGAPPYLPYAPALVSAEVSLERVRVMRFKQGARDLLWSVERLLRTPACGVVMAWVSRLNVKNMRRLQLAAAAGRSVGVVFLRHDSGGSPAPLRLRLQPEESGLRIHILKARGGFGGRSVVIPLR